MKIAPDVLAGSIALGPDAIVLLGILVISASLPLLMVSATAPLLQCWFALSPHPRASDPYFLYAASNAGSLMALLAYPLLIEPALGLSLQSRLWRFGFLLLAILVLFCGAIARRLSRSSAAGTDRNVLSSDASSDSSAKGKNVSKADLARWLILVFIPSSWLMGVTAYLTTDLAAIPLLWVIPLAIYLLSFVLAFARPTGRVVRFLGGLLPYFVAAPRTGNELRGFHLRCQFRFISRRFLLAVSHVMARLRGPGQRLCTPARSTWRSPPAVCSEVCSLRLSHPWSSAGLSNIPWR